MANQVLPSLWLLTDERLGARLWDAVARLPRGAGVVLRHHGCPRAERLALARRLARLARKGGLRLVVAGLAGFDGLHWHRGAPRHRPARGIITASAHGARELHTMFRAGADLVFLSPVFATASHPDAAALGPVRFGLMRRGAAGPVIALGGMDFKRAARVPADGVAGIALWQAVAAGQTMGRPRGPTGRARPGAGGPSRPTAAFAAV